MTLPKEEGLSPGQQLLAARKLQGKTLAQIAEATRIFENRLEAIERDEYSLAGTAPAFVIGYVKTYAKHVGIDEKPFVGVVEDYFKKKALIDEQNNPIIRPRKATNWTPWLATAVALAIFMALGQWFFTQQQESVTDDRLTEGLTPEQAIVAQPIASAAARAQRVPLTQRDENLISRDLVASVEESKKAAIESVGASLTSAAQAQSPSLGSASNSPEEVIESETLELEGDAVSGDVLKLVFNADCWVEVVDANGRKQLAQLAKNGDEIQLVGKAPFDLKVGDATAVEGFVNGRLLELTARPGRRVLRIQVGP